jgi:hypothetical protein
MDMKTLGDPNVRVATIERIKTVRADSPAKWGRMNAHQMLCHCSDAFLTVFGEKQVSPATGLFQRTVMKWGALWFPAPWPQGIPTRPEIDLVALGYEPEDFSGDRRTLIGLVERFCRPDCNLRTAFHPIFGRMSPAEWRRWGYLHLDHHLRQFGA